ncbi:MAG: hypothetical protein ISQ83_08610 [Alphaproteobacteria bacterium]|nr:hypothetical protein [Alphaproteobacteria bacterium]
MTTTPKDNTKVSTRKPRISWNDKAITDLNHVGTVIKRLRLEIKFKDKSGSPKGVSLRYTPKTDKKVFQYHYMFNGIKDVMAFEFIPGLFGTLQMEEALLNLKKKYYDPSGSFWKFNPKDKVKTKAEVMTSQSKTVREVIQRLLEDNYPRKSKVGKLASVSQRQFSNILIGQHKRLKHLNSYDNDKGWGVTKLDGGLTWSTFWTKYPPTNIQSKAKQVSIYDDGDIGPLLIDNLNNGVVKKFLNARPRTPGGKKNHIKAIQCLWNYAINNSFFGDNIPPDPTKDINIVVDDESNFLGSKWNDKSYDEEERKIIDVGCIKIARTRPFQSECIMLLGTTVLRPEEALKLKKSDVTKDTEGNPIIIVRKEIRKARGRGRTKDLIIDINSPINRALTRLNRQYNRNSKYKFIPWLFPHLKKIDVGTASHGQTGPDIILSKVAKKLVGCNFEIKNQQKMKTIYQWYKQASKGNHSLTPVVVCKMNTREPLVIIGFNDFFELIKS